MTKAEGGGSRPEAPFHHFLFVILISDFVIPRGYAPRRYAAAAGLLDWIQRRTPLV